MKRSRDEEASPQQVAAHALAYQFNANVIKSRSQSNNFFICGAKLSFFISTSSYKLCSIERIYHVGKKIMNRGFAKTYIISILFVFTSIVISVQPSIASSSSPSREFGENIYRGRLLADGEYFKAMQEALEDAQSEIVMSYFLFKTNGYRSSYPDMILSRLIAAAKRGVKVKIVLEREKDQNSMINRNNGETAERLRRGGIEVLFDSPETKTHTKVAVIDRRYVFLGSHNLTSSALQYNNELSFVIDSPQMAREALEYINALDR
jgi:phosphatidylserine/phosphatidylglycerophosphate/cardiolipin synthase-like enzyme